MRTIKNAMVILGVVLVIGAASASAQAPPPPKPTAAVQPRPPQNFPTYLQGQYDLVHAVTHAIRRTVSGSSNAF